MLSGFAFLLLVATSLAPVAVVWGLLYVPERPCLAGAFIGAAVGCWLVCLLLLWLVRRHGEREDLALEEVKNVDSEILSFFLAYAMPLLAGAPGRLPTPALVAFFVFVLVVIARSRMFHVNPLLGLTGYHFFEVLTASGGQYLVLTQSRQRKTKGTMRVIRLSDSMWVEVADAR